jgi:hypothetical protein
MEGSFFGRNINSRIRLRLFLTMDLMPFKTHFRRIILEGFCDNAAVEKAPIILIDSSTNIIYMTNVILSQPPGHIKNA